MLDIYIVDIYKVENLMLDIFNVRYLQCWISTMLDIYNVDIYDVGYIQCWISTMLDIYKV